MPRSIEYTVIIKPSVDFLAGCGKVMIGTNEMGTFLGLTPAKVQQLSCTDRIPLQMRLGLGQTLRWSVLELLDWVAEGCPRRGKWIEMNGWSGWIRRR